MGRIGCPETSVNNYQFTPRNIPEEWRSHLRRSESLNLRTYTGLPSDIDTTNDILWFQIVAVFWMLYYFFWVIRSRLNFMYWRFGTLCSMFTSGVSRSSCLHQLRRWKRCVLKRRRVVQLTPTTKMVQIVFRNVGIYSCLFHLRRWNRYSVPKRRHIILLTPTMNMEQI